MKDQLEQDLEQELADELTPYITAVLRRRKAVFVDQGHNYFRFETQTHTGKILIKAKRK